MSCRFELGTFTLRFTTLYHASEGPFSHATGAGWVRPRPGRYRDAIVVKRRKQRLLIADPHGGVTRSTHM